MNKGFTLIELLAVIVILAIIALIATPIVLSIINDSKESAVMRSAEFYVDAVKNAVMQENMKQGGTLNPEKCEVIPQTDNINCDDVVLEVEVDGEKPSDGSITFDQGKVTGVNLMFGDKTILTDITGEFISVKTEFCVPVTNATKTTGNVPDGTFKPGDEYICEVGKNLKYHFFVLSKNDNNINLILNANIDNNGRPITELNASRISSLSPVNGIYNVIPWINKSDFIETGGIESNFGTNGNTSKGPVTLLKELDKATKNWIYISNLNEVHVDERNNYNGVEITSRVRAPKISELTASDVGCIVGNTNDNSINGSCPLWIADYLSNEILSYDGKRISTNIYGYWIMDAIDFSAGGTVNHKGAIIGTYPDRAGGYLIGMRPVITLKEKNLKK